MRLTKVDKEADIMTPLLIFDFNLKLNTADKIKS